MLLTKNRPSLRSLAIWGLILDSFGYAVLGVNSRLLSEGFEPMTQVYVRIFVGFLLSLLIFGKQVRLDKLKSIPRNDMFWLVVMGTLGYSVSIWFITIANLEAKLVNSSIIYATIPFVVYIYSFFLLKEKFRPKVLLLLLVALYGIGIISSKSFVIRLDHFGIGELFAFLSVLVGAFWSIGRKKMSDHLNNKEITILTMMIASISGIIIGLAKGEPLNFHSFQIPAVILGIVIGAALNFGLTFLENFSFKHLSAVLGNQLLMTSTFFSLLLGYLLYNERISSPELIGGGIIFLSVFFANKQLPSDE